MRHWYVLRGLLRLVKHLRLRDLLLNWLAHHHVHLLQLLELLELILPLSVTSVVFFRLGLLDLLKLFRWNALWFLDVLARAHRLFDASV